MEHVDLGEYVNKSILGAKTRQWTKKEEAIVKIQASTISAVQDS